MRLTRYLVGCCAAALLALPALAAPDDQWSFEATPYLTAAGLQGTVGAGRVKSNIDVSFGDVLSHLDVALEAAFLARRGPLSLQLDTEYIRLSDDASRSVTGPFGRATVFGKLNATAELSIMQANGGYRLLDEQTKIDLIGGARYTHLNADLDLHGTLSVGDAVFGARRNLSGKREWTDAVAGVRISHQLSDELSLQGYADMGGGGSNLTWQALAGVNWQYAKRYSLKLGYRVLFWNYSDNGVVWDMRLHGPYAGLGIRF